MHKNASSLLSSQSLILFESSQVATVVGNLVGQSAQQHNTQVVLQNVVSVLRSVLGPNALSKLLVDSFGNTITVTNDGAKILKEMVQGQHQHPAVKIVAELAQAQCSQVGDGTTSVVLLLGEMLQNSMRLLLQQQFPAQTICDVWREACELVCDDVLPRCSRQYSLTKDDMLLRLVQSTCATKQALAAVTGTKQQYSRLAVDAVLHIYRSLGFFEQSKTSRTVQNAAPSLDLDQFLRVFVVLGPSAKQLDDSTQQQQLLRNGLVLHAERVVSVPSSFASGKRLRVLIVTCPLVPSSVTASQASQVRITDPKSFQLREQREDQEAASFVAQMHQLLTAQDLPEPAKAEAAAERLVVLCTKHIHQKFVALLDALQLEAYQNVRLGEMLTDSSASSSGSEQASASSLLCRCLNARRAITSLNDILALSRDHYLGTAQSFSAHAMGRSGSIGNRADEVRCFVTGVQASSEADASSPLVSVVLRAATKELAKELMHGFEDAIKVCKSIIEDALQNEDGLVRACAGGGAVEAEIAFQLRKHSRSEICVGNKRQLFEAFAQSFEVIPRVLLENAVGSGEVAQKLISLQKAHADQALAYAGIDARGNIMPDAFAASVVDPLVLKQHVVRSALEACCALLRVDTVVMEKMQSRYVKQGPG